jgi:hypothetical protein
MSEFLAVLGLVVLFVTFGLTYRTGRAHSCGSCSAKSTGSCDASCELAHDLPESSHG